MNKFIIILTIAATALITTVNAQIQQGDYMIGGNMVATNLGLNKGTGFNLAITPQIAYFVKDNWSVGGYTNLGFNGAKGLPTTFKYALGALSRYYLSADEKGVDNLLKQGRFFMEGNIGIGGSTISQGGASANGLDLGIGPGYTYFITKDIGLDAIVKYSGNLGFGNQGTISNIGFRLGLNIFFATRKGLDNFRQE
ncbi:hypothetical protein [Halpernia sp. GG3]